MALHRQAARRDGNEAALRAYVEAHGACWQPLSITGGPDAIVGCAGRDALVEVKQPKEKLRASQEQWHRDWRGSAPWVIRTEADADMLIRWLRDSR